MGKKSGIIYNSGQKLWKKKENIGRARVEIFLLLFFYTTDLSTLFTFHSFFKKNWNVLCSYDYFLNHWTNIFFWSALAACKMFFFVHSYHKFIFRLCFIWNIPKTPECVSLIYINPHIAACIQMLFALFFGEYG